MQQESNTSVPEQRFPKTRNRKLTYCVIARDLSETSTTTKVNSKTYWCPPWQRWSFAPGQLSISWPFGPWRWRPWSRSRRSASSSGPWRSPASPWLCSKAFTASTSGQIIIVNYPHKTFQLNSQRESAKRTLSKLKISFYNEWRKHKHNFLNEKRKTVITGLLQSLICFKLHTSTMCIRIKPYHNYFAASAKKAVQKLTKSIKHWGLY